MEYVPQTPLKRSFMEATTEEEIGTELVKTEEKEVTVQRRGSSRSQQPPAKRQAMNRGVDEPSVVIDGRGLKPQNWRDLTGVLQEKFCYVAEQFYSLQPLQHTTKSSSQIIFAGAFTLVHLCVIIFSICQ